MNAAASAIGGLHVLLKRRLRDQPQEAVPATGKNLAVRRRGSRKRAIGTRRR
jgi:hypothetical protein